MEKRKARSDVLPWAVGALVVASATAIVVDAMRASAPSPTEGTKAPVLRPDGTYGTDGPLAVAQGPIYPPHGRILVVGGELASGLGLALREVMGAIEQQVPSIPATPSMISVWDGRVGQAYAIAPFEAFVSSQGIPDAARNLDGQGAPDVVIVVLGEYDAAFGVEGDMLGAAQRLAGQLSTVARDHLPNMIWVLPWAGPHADEIRVPLAAAVLRGAPLHVLPFPPKPGAIDMVDDLHPTVDGYGQLAMQVSAILLEWYKAVGH